MGPYELLFLIECEQRRHIASGKEERKWSHSVVSDSLHPQGLWPTTLLNPWDFPGKSTGMGCHFLLQGIFLTQGSNPGLLHCRLYLLSHQGSPSGRRWLKSKHAFSIFYFSICLWKQGTLRHNRWQSPRRKEPGLQNRPRKTVHLIYIGLSHEQEISFCHLKLLIWGCLVSNLLWYHTRVRAQVSHQIKLDPDVTGST